MSPDNNSKLGVALSMVYFSEALGYSSSRLA